MDQPRRQLIRTDAPAGRQEPTTRPIPHRHPTRRPTILVGRPRRFPARGKAPSPTRPCGIPGRAGSPQRSGGFEAMQRSRGLLRRIVRHRPGLRRRPRGGSGCRAGGVRARGATPPLRPRARPTRSAHHRPAESSRRLQRGRAHVSVLDIQRHCHGTTSNIPPPGAPTACVGVRADRQALGAGSGHEDPAGRGWSRRAGLALGVAGDRFHDDYCRPGTPQRTAGPSRRLRAARAA